MRERPHPTRYETPRQILAATFAYAHFALSQIIGHDAWRDFRVQAARRDYLQAVAYEEKGHVSTAYLAALVKVAFR